MKKLCPTHGKHHLLIPDGPDTQTWLCIHPLCILKLIHHVSDKYKPSRAAWRLIREKRAEDDFVQFIALELVKDREKGKTLISINRIWLYFRLLKFINQELKKFIPLTDLPTGQRGNKTFVHYDPQLVDKMDEAIGTYQQQLGTTPEDDIWRNQVVAHIQKTYGKEEALYFMGTITILDYGKLKGLSYAKAKQSIYAIRKELKEWCDL
jgi:hypothetical protein